MNDTTPEIERLQRDLMLKMTPNKRIAAACEMFMAARESFLRSLPKGLSQREVKKQLYYRTYGEHLPEDFFDER
jgi:hypothetical protein